MATLGQYLSQRRQQLRLTQQEVGDRLRNLGIDRATPTIAHWENDRQKVPIEFIPELAQALETSPVTLYDYAGVLDKLPGSEIIKLMDSMTGEELARMERVIRAMIKDN